ncbi:hypothetical protein D3C78_1022560 [compost metagenome]
MTTIRAILIRQVKSTRNTAVKEPFAMLAFWIQANVMSRQRVNLGNTEEGSYYRGTYRAPRPYEISVLIGLFHQSFGDEIIGRETVFNDRLQFLLQAFDDNFRQVFTINRLRRVIASIADFFICPI